MKLKNRSRQRRALIPHHFSKSYHINAPRLKAVLTLFITFFLCLLVFAIVFNFSETTLARGVLIPAQGDGNRPGYVGILISGYKKGTLRCLFFGKLI